MWKRMAAAPIIAIMMMALMPAAIASADTGSDPCAEAALRGSPGDCPDPSTPSTPGNGSHQSDSHESDSHENGRHKSHHNHHDGEISKGVRQAEEFFLKVPQCQSSSSHFEECKVAREKIFERINEAVALTGTCSLLELVPEPTTKVVGVLCLTAEGAHAWQEVQDSLKGDFASLRKLGAK
jgi:hypothetical protein